MTWHTFTLSRAERAERENELQMAFDLCFTAAAGPDDMALLAEDEATGDRHYYASPAMGTWAANLLEQYGATPCTAPQSRGKLTLLVGHQGCTDWLLGD
jgi:hypothetical protein